MRDTIDISKVSSLNHIELLASQVKVRNCFVSRDIRLDGIGSSLERGVLRW